MNYQIYDLEKHKNNIGSRYLSGETYHEIANDFPCSATTIQRRLKSWGIFRRTPSKRIDLLPRKDEIVSRYLSGESTRTIARDLGVGYGLIGNRLREWGVKLRNPSFMPRYDIQHDAFDLLSEESMYFCGLLAADGNVCRTAYKNSQLVITLVSNDVDVLKKFRAFVSVNNDKPIYDHGNGSGKAFSFASEQIGQRLISFGIIPDKSLVLEIKNKELLSSRHFWRGAIDGDGTVRRDKDGKALIGLYSGSRVFLEQFRGFLGGVGMHQNVIHKHGDKNMYSIIYKSYPAISIFNLLYSDCTVYMNRKHVVAQSFLGG